MTVNELMQTLKGLSGKTRETTCDVLIAGDGEREVTKAATCFKATAEVIDKAARAGAQLLITHEPVFYLSENRDEADDQEKMKWALIDRAGISIYRFHDYAHEADPDFIHDGFIRSTGLPIKSPRERDLLGICRYELNPPYKTAAQWGAVFSQSLHIPHPQLVGDPDVPVRVVCLGLGAVGTVHVRALTLSDADLYVTGEVGEVLGQEYIRDAVYFGQKKALLLLGHCGAEYAGMRRLAEFMSANYVETEYIHCGEVFKCL